MTKITAKQMEMKGRLWQQKCLIQSCAKAFPSHLLLHPKLIATIALSKTTAWLWKCERQCRSNTQAFGIVRMPQGYRLLVTKQQMITHPQIVRNRFFLEAVYRTSVSLYTVVTAYLTYQNRRQMKFALVLVFNKYTDKAYM